MANLQNLIEQYLDGPNQLRQAIAGMTREQAQARPIAGKWSTLEVIAHLADFDPILADRMKRVIAEDNPMLVGADENKFAAALAYHDRDLEEDLRIVEATRGNRLKARRASCANAGVGVAASWQRHTERGPRTLEQLLTTSIGHIPHHVKFIHEKRLALGLK